MSENAPQANVRNSALVLCSLFVVALIVRLFIPFLQSDSMHYYNAVGWAVVSGENWGKQAVVGVLEYSPIPTVLLLLLSPLSIFPKLGLHANRILPAVAQALTVVALFAVSGEFVKRWWSRAIATVLGMVILGIGLDSHFVPGRGLLVADPFWTLAPPAILLIGFARRLGTFDSVRPLLVFSLCASVLVFGGPGGMILALAAMAAVLTYGRKELSTQGGTPLLSLMPIGYAFVLFLLFNLVIMSNAFFAFGRLIPFISNMRQSLPSLSGWKLFAALLWWVVALIALIPMNRIPFYARFTWILAMACLPIFLLRRGGRLFIGGESILMGVVLVALFFGLISIFKSRNLSLAKGVLALGITVISLGSVTMLKRHAHAFEPFVDSSRPMPTEITDYLDRPKRWKESRVLVFGARASSLYCPHNATTEKSRFIGNVDFNVNVVMEHIQAEQLHLLIPPNTGQFYPKNSFFAQVHARDVQADWLFFEMEWNGWQLWRCVRARPQPGSIEQ